MSYDFLDLDGFDDITEQRVGIALASRLDSVRPFVAKSRTPEEMHERISVIAPEVRRIVADVCDEYGFDKPDQLTEQAFDDLRTANPLTPAPAVEQATPDLSAGDLQQRLAEAESNGDYATAQMIRQQMQNMNSNYQASVKVAEDFEHDNSQQETVDLDSETTDDGILTEPFPKMDKGPYDWHKGLPPIDVDSKVHPMTRQDPTKVPTVEDWNRDDVAKRPEVDTTVDPSTPIGDTKALPASTWSDTSTQANPVAASYRLVD